jgi:hypothetical protein
MAVKTITLSRRRKSVTRRDLVLALLASSEGRPYTPAQLQKAVFLVSRNMPLLIEGEGFHFVPYDYGPFDSDVYVEAANLGNDGEVIIAPSEVGRWNTYAASDAGLVRGKRLLSEVDTSVRDYLGAVCAWVRSQSFSSLVKSIYEAYPEMRANSIFRG